jgi:hypothetical protein
MREAPCASRVCGAEVCAGGIEFDGFGASPRVRAQGNERLAAVKGLGASPRVRGGTPRPARGVGEERCIPACAGRSRWLRSRSGIRWVHPRVCGAELFAILDEASFSGASPRVRGGDGFAVRAAAVDGCIPACAGRRCPPRTSAPVPGVHPRVCGAEGGPVDAASAATGASPRVRGGGLLTWWFVTRHLVFALVW